ncbi:SMU1112c/YaeR family gloxylase I-like metalloprotein [Sphingobacterium psychroaquaticum]|uniref:Glyoxylase I family protein n=1 Tax=Sphingobacterium psychroaquaticum TaxID=561061 RepID=A0A1X7IK20_9SPHI|nr:VOC family protein [Sphingobacterium psychroaquaticum]SMG14762.1 glyoxylase I family protein [Sphingobacterium psychroaquaticum]
MGIQVNKVHHIAIICKDYSRSLHYYTTVIGLELVSEIYRQERDSYKADLALNGAYIIELFSFPDPPARVSQPEALGLRHLAFEVNDVARTAQELQDLGQACEAIRIDPETGKRFFFTADPDGLPIEFYEK